MSTALDQIIVLRNDPTLIDLSYQDAMARFKPLVAQVIPSIDELVAAMQNSEGMVDFGNVKCFYDGAVIDVYLNKVGADWCTADTHEMGAAILAIAEANDMHYYSRCKEDFFATEAYREAEKAGKKFCMMENLS